MYSHIFGTFIRNHPNEDRCLIKILLAASKKAIRRTWYKVNSSTSDHWMDIVEETHNMEGLKYSIRRQLTKCKDFAQDFFFSFICFLCFLCIVLNKNFKKPLLWCTCARVHGDCVSGVCVFHVSG